MLMTAFSNAFVSPVRLAESQSIVQQAQQLNEQKEQRRVLESELHTIRRERDKLCADFMQHRCNIPSFCI